MTITPGTKLGRYEIRSKLGEGGIGDVCAGQLTIGVEKKCVGFESK